jgi:glycosyltransferase involved in cell wall biosynthesis
MKILFVTRWYPNSTHTYDGVFVREHAKAARAAGHEVVVLHVPGGPGDGQAAWQMVQETDAALTEGIPAYHVYCRAVSSGRLTRISKGATYWRYVWSAYRSARRLRAEGFRPDVIHAHVFNAGPAGVLIARLFRRPLVVTEHSTVFPRRTLSRSGRRMAAFAFGRAARVLPVCEFLQHAIEAYGIKARFTIVPNAVDTALFFPTGETAAVRTGRAHRGRKRLLFVGTLEATHHKGFPTLVEAFTRLRLRRSEWRLEVVGDGPSRPDYERLVAEAGLSDQVTFLGRRPKTEIAGLMRAADLFVLPSHFENLPCVIIEAMASGLPVVSTAVGGIPEMVTDRDGILVPPQDPATLAKALERALSSLASFDRSAIAGRARARFGLEAVGAQLGAVYEQVASPRPPS